MNSLFPSITCTPCSYEAVSPSALIEAKWPFERIDGAVGLLSNPEGRRSAIFIFLCSVYVGVRGGVEVARASGNRKDILGSRGPCNRRKATD